jgi:hypothetical protein|nr:MAG TPA: hypothetical protein [Caudoviricetes sp.]
MFFGSFGDQGSNRGDTEFIRKSVVESAVYNFMQTQK